MIVLKTHEYLRPSKGITASFRLEPHLLPVLLDLVQGTKTEVSSDWDSPKQIHIQRAMGCMASMDRPGPGCTTTPSEQMSRDPPTALARAECLRAELKALKDMRRSNVRKHGAVMPFSGLQDLQDRISSIIWTSPLEKFLSSRSWL